MTDLVASALWASVFAYAVWSTHQAALAYVARREEAARPLDAQYRVELDALRKDLSKTQRVASSAALAAGLREDQK